MTERDHEMVEAEMRLARATQNLLVKFRELGYTDLQILRKLIEAGSSAPQLIPVISAMEMGL